VLGTTSFTWNTAQYDDGNHIVRLYAQDAGGLESEITKNVIIDNTPPIIIVTSPINNTKINKDSIEVTWQAADNIKLDHFDIYLDEALISGNVSKSQRSITITGLSQGEHVITIRAYDEVGNYAETKLIFTYRTLAIHPIYIAVAIVAIGCTAAILIKVRKKKLT